MENMEYILSLGGAALSFLAALLTVAVKFMTAIKEMKAVISREKIVEKLPELVEKAETFTTYSGKEKKAYVMDKISEFSWEKGIEADLQFVSEKIEELVRLSRQVNFGKAETEEMKN